MRALYLTFRVPTANWGVTTLYLRKQTELMGDTLFRWRHFGPVLRLKEYVV